MRYSRMLEESSFANKKADYLWLLILSSVMLLVSRRQSPLRYSTHIITLGPFTPRQPPLPFLLSRIRPHLPLVPPAPFHPHIPLRALHHHSSLPPPRARRLFVGAQRHLAGGCRRPGRVCCGACGVVHAGCVDEGNGGWAELLQSAARETVSDYFCVSSLCMLKLCLVNQEATFGR